MTKVVLTEPFAPAVVERLRSLLPATVEFDVAPSLRDEDFAAHAGDADVLLVIHRPIDARALAMAPNVRFIQRCGAGYDNIDVAAAAARGIPVAYTPGANAGAVAEHTILLMLALLKRFVPGEQAARAGRWATDEVIQGGIGDLAGATVGLVGFGAIGQAVAMRLAAFESRVLYTARHRADEAIESATGASYAVLPDLLAASTIVSLHLSLTGENQRLIGEAQLATMPPGSYLVNTARGGLVDEAALRRAIVSGHLAGAALDVLEREEDGANPFADLPQVIVTPHIAGGSRGGAARIIDLAVANVVRFLSGEPPADLVPTR